MTRIPWSHVALTAAIVWCAVMVTLALTKYPT